MLQDKVLELVKKCMIDTEDPNWFWSRSSPCFSGFKDWNYSVGINNISRDKYLWPSSFVLPWEHCSDDSEVLQVAFFRKICCMVAMQ